MAAGVGSRLSDAPHDPKCTLSIGTGSVISHTMDILRDKGVEPHMVIGYERNKVRAALSDYPEVVFHENPFYRATNSIGSLWIARSVITSAISFAVSMMEISKPLPILVALPMMASLLLVDLALGFLAKSAPQFNIFAIGFSFKLIAGFSVMVVMMGLTLNGISQFIPLLQDVLRDFMKLLGDVA